MMKYVSKAKKLLRAIINALMRVDIKQKIIYASCAAVLVIFAVILCCVASKPELHMSKGSDITADDGRIYAVSPADGKLYRIKKKTSDAVSDLVQCSNPMVDGKYIYYIGAAEYGKPGIYRTNLRKGKTEKLYSGNIDFFDIYNNELYFISSAVEGEFLSVMRLDGSRRRELSKLSVDSFCVGEDRIFYTDKQGRFYSNTLDGKNELLLKDISAQQFAVLDNKLYYLDNGAVYRCRFDGSKQKKIINGGAEEFTLIGKKIYYKNSKGFFNTRSKCIYAGKTTDFYTSANSIFTYNGDNILKIGAKTKKTQEISFSPESDVL